MSRVTTAYLLTCARRLPTRGHEPVDIPGRGGRPAPTATVQLAAAAVWVPAPVKTPGRSGHPVVPAWVVRVWEADPPAGVVPVEWLLLTSVPMNGRPSNGSHCLC